MFALMFDIVKNPVEVSFPEADNAVSALPLKNLLIQLLVDIMRRCALQLLNKFAQRNKRLNTECQMHMVISATEAMEIHAFGSAALVL